MIIWMSFGHIKVECQNDIPNSTFNVIKGISEMTFLEHQYDIRLLPGTVCFSLFDLFVNF
jgi:hypothetical protein